ncbi:AAA family ATPase [Bacillus shivajii]|uniref:AAA family ATPase n=1 Tax=Bacillus shivajii TaxID=1983719 RepID=UPI001CFB417A|nr:AAA family ATPase [Bacillus shivajii]UCZ51587.1 AAA family ATPase [Bacillus shivajii]
MNMNERRINSLKEKIDDWKTKPSVTLKETEITRELHFVKSTSLKEANIDDIDYIHLLSLAALARFYRVQEADDKVRNWLLEAWELDRSNQFFLNAFIETMLPDVSKPILNEPLPRIRETDHGQGKKNTIDRISELIKESHQNTQEMMSDANRLQIAANELGDQPLIEKMSTMTSQLKNVHSLTNELLDASEQFKQSISGIYYSKEKQSLFKETLEEFVHAQQTWDHLREKVTESEKNPLTELQSMIGLDDVKEKVQKYYYYLRYEQERKRQGYHFENERNLNMIFTGNPGTGKTTIARLLAKIYYHLGVLPKEKVVEVDRSHLVGAYLGQTEEKTTEIIKQSVGGILFIDEAYSLKREGATGNDYGQTAIDTLVAAMTSGEYAGQFSVILAGYPEEMRTFLWANPGLRSRFPESNHIHLPDFSSEELIEIAEQIALDNDFTISEDGITSLKQRIEKEQVDESFGNARTVKNIVLDAIFKKGAKAGQTHDYSEENFTILAKSDFAEQRSTPRNEKSGEEELQELIGLSAVKKEVQVLTSFVKMQKIREESNLPKVPIQLHAIFSGPPGTGKTTVAKIYGKILHELGLLKRGHLVVAGRSDLVAGYVGQTATKTKRKIKEALGGVLFIDEAYSLLSKGGQDFGKEAIDTLVEEMTRHEENLVIILAGYDEPMDQLLLANPGLPSRFKKRIQFPSYTTNELIKILQYYVRSYHYEVDDDIVEQLYNAIEFNRPSGNGRAMKDLVEAAIQRQAYRITSSNLDYESEYTLTKLEAVDFPILLNEGEEDHS